MNGNQADHANSTKETAPQFAKPTSSQPQMGMMPAAMEELALPQAVQRPAWATPRQILALQRSYGNEAVSGMLQAKLTVGAANDSYEQEADRVAAEVVRAPAPEEEATVQAKPAPRVTSLAQRRAQEEAALQMAPMFNLPLQRSAPSSDSFQAGPEVEQRLQARRGNGKPLAPETRAFMEPRFGADFGGVRIHTGAESTQLNRALGAKAFTHGQDVYFNQSEFDPGSSGGKQLLAHELTHVVQQGGAGTVRREVSEEERAAYVADVGAPGHDDQLKRAWGSDVEAKALAQQLGISFNIYWAVKPGQGLGELQPPEVINADGRANGRHLLFTGDHYEVIVRTIETPLEQSYVDQAGKKYRKSQYGIPSDGNCMYNAIHSIAEKRLARAEDIEQYRQLASVGLTGEAGAEFQGGVEQTIEGLKRSLRAGEVDAFRGIGPRLIKILLENVQQENLTTQQIKNIQKILQDSPRIQHVCEGDVGLQEVVKKIQATEELFTVNANTALRERPEEGGVKRGQARFLGKGTQPLSAEKDIVVKKSEAVADRGGGSSKWVWVEVIGGNHRGYEGYLREARLKSLGSIPRDQLGWVTSTTKLESSTREKLGKLSPGDMFRIFDNDIYRDPVNNDRWVGVYVLSGSHAGASGFLREGKRLMSDKPLLEEEPAPTPEKELEEASASRPEPAQKPTDANGIVDVAALRDALTLLDNHRKHMEERLNIDKIDTQVVVWVKEALESDWAKRLLPQGMEKLRNQWDAWVSEAAADISSRSALIRKRVMDADRILTADEGRLAEAKEKYQEGIAAYEKAQVPFQNMQRKDYIFEQTKIKAEKYFNKQALKQSNEDSSMAHFCQYEGFKENAKNNLKGLITNPGGSLGGVAGSVAEGGDPVLSGWSGHRGTYEGDKIIGGKLPAAWGGDSAKLPPTPTVVSAEDEKTNSGFKEKGGTYGKGEYYGLDEKMKEKLGWAPPSTQEAATWWFEKFVGKWFDPANFQLNENGATFTTPKISLLKPWPPLASIAYMIPIYPGIGVKLEAKATAKAAFAGKGSVNWGGWRQSAKATEQESADLFNKNRQLENQIKLLSAQKRDANLVGDQDERAKKLTAIQKEYNKLSAEHEKTQTAFAKVAETSALKNPNVKVDIGGVLSGGISGEVFGGLALGIPALNVSGGLYGELGLSASAQAGLKGEIAREKGEWKSAKFGGGIKIGGDVKAELGAKLSAQVLFFNFDLVKFKFADWTIGNFGLGAEAMLGKGGGLKITDKTWQWFKGKPPIETEVVEAKEKAEKSKNKLTAETRDPLEKGYTDVTHLVEEANQEGNIDEGIQGLDARFTALEQGEKSKAAKLDDLTQLEEEVRAFKQKSEELHGKLDPELKNLEGLRKKVENRRKLIFKSLTKETETDIDAYASQSYEMLRQSQEMALPLYQKYQEALAALKPAKMDLENYVQENARAAEYKAKEKEITSQLVKVRELEVQKKKQAADLEAVQNRKEGGRFHRASSEFKDQKKQDVDRIRAEMAKTDEKLADARAELKQLKTIKTAIREANVDVIKEYKKRRDKVAQLEKNLDSVKKDVGNVQSTIVRAQSHIEYTKAMNTDIGGYAEKFKAIAKIKADSSNRTQKIADLLKHIEALRSDLEAVSETEIDVTIVEVIEPKEE